MLRRASAMWTWFVLLASVAGLGPVSGGHNATVSSDETTENATTTPTKLFLSGTRTTPLATATPSTESQRTDSTYATAAEDGSFPGSRMGKQDGRAFNRSGTRRVKHVHVTNLNADFSGNNGIHNTTQGGEITVTSTEKIETFATFSGSTHVYIIGIVGVVPACGAFLWCVRWFVTKSRKKPKQASLKNDRQPPEPPRGPLKKTFVPQDLTICAIPHANKGVDKDEAPKVPPSVREYRRNSCKIRKLSPWEVPHNHIRLLHVLGEGNFGQVLKAEVRHLCGVPGPMVVAVKTVKENASSKDKEDLLKELQIMQQLGPHPNVVTLLGCCSLQEPYYVILEYVMQGKLLAYLRDHRFRRKYYNYPQGLQSLSSRDLTLFAYHVATGMEYISSRGIIHRDLAARNVLVDHNNVCKVADFGLSKSVRDNDCPVYEQKSKGALPIRWMAPESLYMNIFTLKSDVWAFGILLWEIVTLGSTPYPGMGAREVIQFVREGYVMERPDHCRPELYRVMRTCWLADPGDRPTFSDLRGELARLLEVQMGYVDLDHFPENCYYNLYQSPGEKV